MRRRLNVKRLMAVFGVTVLVGLLVHLLHGYQVKRQAGSLVARAERAEADGNYQTALDYLRRYLGFRPMDTEALAHYASLLAREEVATTPQARFRAAIVLESVLRREPTRRAERDQIIDLYQSIRRYKDAQIHLKHLLNSEPDNGKLLGKLAKCQQEQGIYREARDSYERAIRKPSPEVDNYAALAYLLREHTGEVVRAGKDRKTRETPATVTQLADGVLDRFVEANPRVCQGYIARAQYRRRYPLPAGRETTLEAVKKDLQQALELDRGNAEALLALAELATDERDLPQARKFLLQGLAAHPRDWHLYLALVRLERAEGRSDDALATLREGLRKQTEQLELLYERADLLVERGAVEEAREAIAQLKSKGVEQPELDLLSARLHARDRKWSEALNLLVGAYSGLQGRENLARSPFAQRLLEQCATLQAWCYQQLGDHFRAQMVYQRMLARTPRSLEARLGIAVTHEGLGRRREAEEQYRQLLKLSDSHQGGWVQVARLVLQRNLEQETPDWDEVNEALSQAERIAPRPAEVALMRAQALVTQGKPGQARDVLVCNLLAATPLPLGLIRPDLLSIMATPTKQSQAPLLVGLSVLEDRAGRRSAALLLLQEAQERFGDMVEFRLAQVGYWERRGGSEARKALAELERDLGKFRAEESRQLRMNLAVAYTRLSQPEQSRRLWEQLAEENPDDWVVRSILFELALEKNDEKAADDLLTQLRRIHTEDGVLWRNAQVRYLLHKAARGERSQLDGARKLAGEIASRWPGWVGVLLTEAQIEEMDGKPDKALKKYQEAINRGGATTQAVNRAMQILFAQQRFQEAHALQAKLPREAGLTPGMDRVAAAVSLQANDNAGAVARAERSVSRDSKNYADHLFLGQVYWAAGQLDKAHSALERARQHNEKAPETWVTLVSFLFVTGKKDQALGELRRAEKHLTGTTGLVALARCYEVVGENDKAAGVYNSPAVARSSELPARRAAALYQLRNGKTKEAQDHLHHLVKAADPHDPETVTWARGMLAVLAALSGNHADTKDALAKLGTSGASKSAAGVFGRRIQAAILANRANRPDLLEAIRLLEELIDEGVAQPPDRLLLAQLYEVNNDWPKARKQLVLLRKSPQGDSLPNLVAYTSAMLRHDELDEAEQAVNHLEKVDPDNLAVLALKAQVWHRRGKGKDAVALLTGYATKQGKSFGQVAAVLESLKENRAAGEMYQLHARKSPNPAAMLAYAEFLGRQKRPGEALDVCEQAWAKLPAATVVDACLSILESAEDEAVRTRVDRQFQAALRKDPRSAVLRFALANLRVLQGKYADAEKLYRALIAESRDNLLAKNNLAWMLASQTDRGEEAVKLIEEAIRAAGPQALLLDTQAVAYLATGKTKEAIRILEGLVKEAPTDATYHLHLAEAYSADRNRQSAQRSLQLARQAGLKAETLHPLERQAYARLLQDLGETVTSVQN